MAIAKLVRGGAGRRGAYLGDVERVDEDGGDDGGPGRRDGPLRESQDPLGRWRRRRGGLRGGHGEEGKGEGGAVRPTVGGGGRIDCYCCCRFPRNRGAVEKFGRERGRSEVVVGARSRRHGSRTAPERDEKRPPLPRRFVAVTTWRACSDVFPSGCGRRCCEREGFALKSEQVFFSFFDMNKFSLGCAELNMFFSCIV